MSWKLRVQSLLDRPAATFLRRILLLLLLGGGGQKYTSPVYVERREFTARHEICIQNRRQDLRGGAPPRKEPPPIGVPIYVPELIKPFERSAPEEGPPAGLIGLFDLDDPELLELAPDPCKIIGFICNGPGLFRR
uniref:Uncharacterized protein n=1 Tax=Tenebrio molitor TaxID=7067 RepID=A0A8J6L459_TENMO|nr:hypothetical protein GEV33_015185 [Tenebrio molitor]